MKITTEYNKYDLRHGKCKSCGQMGMIVEEQSLTEPRFEKMCPDCIEAIKFEEMTMKDL